MHITKLLPYLENQRDDQVRVLLDDLRAMVEQHDPAKAHHLAMAHVRNVFTGLNSMMAEIRDPSGMSFYAGRVDPKFIEHFQDNLHGIGGREGMRRLRRLTRPLLSWMQFLLEHGEQYGTQAEGTSLE